MINTNTKVSQTQLLLFLQSHGPTHHYLQHRTKEHEQRNLPPPPLDHHSMCPSHTLDLGVRFQEYLMMRRHK